MSTVTICARPRIAREQRDPPAQPAPPGPPGQPDPTAHTGDNGATGETGATGPQELTWRGDFVPDTMAYDQNDAVHYSDGSAYICVNPSGCAAATTVFDIPGDWQLLAQAGDTGPIGA